MKRLFALFACAVIIAAALGACSQNTVETIKKEAETITSRIGENLDDMAENATVNDGDGFINEDGHGSTFPSSEYSTDPALDKADDESNEEHGLLEDNTDNTETDDFI